MTDVSVHRRAAKMMLVGIGLLTVILTTARPQWGTRMEEITRRGSDVVVVIDTSLSMAAEDVSPDRLGLARHAVDSLLRRIEGNRVALVTFAGRATTNCPLTLDLAAIRLFLDTTDVQSVPVAGTSLTEALETALGAFHATEPLETRSRAVVLLTDGEDHEGGVEEIAASYKSAGVPIFAIGVGTTRGAPIPVTDSAGFESGYKKDREGKVVTTRLDETVLQQLALATGGRYYRATAAQDEIDEVAEALGSLDSRELGATLRARFEERFQIPLSLAFFALLADALLGDRRREREARR
jgi:Ca-activated chloride channel family protein